MGPEVVQYFLEKDLPIRVVLEPGRTSERSFELDDYEVVDGIALPTKIKETHGPLVETFTARYEVNVDYDQGIFSGPPDMRRGPRGWAASAPRAPLVPPKNCGRS